MAEKMVSVMRPVHDSEAEELKLLTDLERAISEGNDDSLKKFSINNISAAAEDQVTLRRDYYSNASIPNNTNLVILACKYNRVKVVEYLLDCNSKIVSDVSASTRGTAILPNDEDDMCHNALYYAIRSGNVDLLDTLINKWPNKYFAAHSGKLDTILSQAYEELKLKNVPLTEEIEIFVENNLINLRFFSNASGKNRNVKGLNNIRERIELVLQNISALKADYSNKEKVDDKFLFIAKFIAQNVHIIKRQLKSTYDRLPWEEIEFCLISFVYYHIKQQEINVFYHVTLNKSKILNHLEHFGKRLKDEMDIIESVNIGKFADLPKLKRENIVAEIVKKYPEFEELYSDYQQIRDIHSLKKLSDYLKLALSIDPKEREGQIVVTRVLQVIGEFLKNTLESPKLSSTTSELLLLSLPKNTRQVITGLRNSLSHAYSLSKRTEIEENTDVDFYIGVQNDIKRIDNVINDILYNNRIKMIKILLTKITNSESLDEIKEVTEIFSNIKLDNFIAKSSKAIEGDNKLETLIKELRNSITDKTSYETELFNQINNIINFVKSKSENMKSDYRTSCLLLWSLACQGLNDNKFDHNDVRVMKFVANKTLENISSKMETHNLKEIAELSTKISCSARLRIKDGDLDKINRLSCEIFYIAEFGTGDLKWIEGLKEKLNDKGSFIPMDKERKACNITDEKYNNQLALKLSELKGVFRNNTLSGKLNLLPSYKNDKKLQTVVEMLVLDVMSILGRSKKYLENNLLFLDDTTPLLTGKCLRNHLAHDNTLVDVLLSDPSMAVILNAKELISKNVIKSKKKIGKLVTDDPCKLKNKYNQSLITITNQGKMLAALEEGNLEDFKSYLRKGADINARSIDLSTTLHFAAKGPNIEIIKFLLNHNLDANAKDINGQSPLHIAAAHGRKNVVEFLIREANLHVDDIDNSRKTPLHIAARNGHKDTVEILLKYNVNTNNKDLAGLSPLHYAIKNNHIDLAKLLLDKEMSADINEAMGGYTSLHIAAERGYLELVNFLLRKGANVNARNDKQGIPLHTTALNGHLEVVKVLILKGADVKARVINGCTPLHYAVENGHAEIANILLQHGADVNVTDKTYNNTPLHYAAKDGYEKIVDILLINNANVNIATVEGMTPLHLAVQSGHLKIVTALLKFKANIHARDINNDTLLHCAADSGHMEIAELLIKDGVGINDKAYDNRTPLHVAALKGQKGIVELLIKNKAQIKAKDIYGNTPLHSAAMNGSKDIIDLLIKNEAEIDARTDDNMTPLHLAALNGHNDAIASLIEKRADVNNCANCGLTPLYAAIVKGHKHIVNLLIKNGAKVNMKGVADTTPLHIAVEAGHKEIVKILVANKANVDDKGKNLTPLVSAIRNNQKEIVEVLIENGASVNGEFGEPISFAVLAGYRDIVEILLKNKAHIDMKYPEDATLLHLAAKRGHTEILKSLIKRGANVDAMDIYGTTPLYFAAQEGHKDVAEILIANRANVNVVNIEGAPLHIAAGRGHIDVVQVLLSNGAKVNVKDIKNRMALELAVANGNLRVVKMLLQYKKVDVNAKCFNDGTILHIASQENNLEIVKFLVNEGCNINAKNSSGSKPIHIAAREGFKDAVEFYLSKGSSINEFGMANQTLLHYAAMNDQLEIVKYLVAHGADVNAKDTSSVTPMHIATAFNYKDVVEILLKNGAIYNDVDNLCRKPLDMTGDEDTINLLKSTEKLFESVKHNNCSEVEKDIRAGAIINARNADGGTPLHYAAWKGFEGIVKILLENKANPNAVGSKGFTPMHYAAKFSHLTIIKALLIHSAKYNVVSDSGKTPSDLTVDKSITSLFKLINDSFRKVKVGNVQVISDLNNVKDVDTVKAVMSACNRENNTLIVAAIHSNFSKVEQLKEIWQSDISPQINIAGRLLNQGNYKDAQHIFRNAFERRKEILGPDNPGTLDIQKYLGHVLYKQGSYQEALNIFEEIFQKQKEMLGLDHENTLSTRSVIALVLHRQGKNKKAFNIYQQVYKKQKEILGSNHSDTLDTHFHMALVLHGERKYEEALIINRAVYGKRKETLGPHNLKTVSAQNNIAMVLAEQGKYEESVKIYKEVFEKKKILLGINHVDTLRTMHSIAAVHYSEKKYPEALKAFQEVLDIQKKALPRNHPETLLTQYNIGGIHFIQGKFISALKAYKESFDQRKAIFGPNHPTILDTLEKIELINMKFKLEGSTPSELLQHLQNAMNIAANKGDAQTVEHLLKDGADVNDKDIEGRTPLHFAINNGDINIVNILLENGANVTEVTNKGNTPLHTATSKCYKAIVELLLQHTSQHKLNDFINAKTASNGTTSLHVAAKAGCLEIVKSLLKCGATYRIENKEGKAPVDLSKDKSVIKLLKLIDELFSDIKNSNVVAIDKLRALKPDEFLAIINARNNRGNTLLQVAIANKHQNIVGELLKMLKGKDQ